MCRWIVDLDRLIRRPVVLESSLDDALMMMNTNSNTLRTVTGHSAFASALEGLYENLMDRMSIAWTWKRRIGCVTW